MKTLLPLLLLAPLLALDAQEPSEQPTFEVASIRPSTGRPGAGLAGPHPGGRFIAVGVTLRSLVSSGARARVR